MATVTLNAQFVKNLVPNPGFEEYKECPTWFSSVALPNTPQLYLQDWVAPNRGTSDYYNACAWDYRWVGVPYNAGGCTPAKEQNAYAGFYVFANADTNSNEFLYREYLQVRLKQPLVKDVGYCVSFYVTPMDTNLHNSDLYIFAAKNIGAYLSKKQVIDTATQQSYQNLPYEPQITADKVIDDTAHWTLISGVFTAEGGEEWLTIGNFEDDINTRPLVQMTVGFPSNIAYNISYYFIDQVSVYGLNTVSALPNEEIYTVCDKFPAPVTAMAGFENYRWSNGDIGQTGMIPDTGYCWVEASFEGCVFRDSVKVIASPPPVVDLGPDIDLCVDGKLTAVTLKNSEPLANYTWSTGLIYDSIIVKRPGIYTLKTRHVCGDISDEIELTGCGSTLYIPNIITPDSQDDNAVFIPRGRNVELRLLEIYDHDGHLVYREEQPAAGWDGTVRGRSVQPGVYIWHLRYWQNDIDTEVEKYGDLTVIR